MGDIARIDHRAVKSGDNRQWTPIECLQDTITDLQTGEAQADKLMIIRISTSDEQFKVGYSMCNIKASEILAALAILQAQTLQQMGYLPD